MDIGRREFLVLGGQSAVLALAACATKTPPRLADDGVAESSPERRIAAVVQAYDGQGNHRTATDGDIASANWLIAESRKAGADALLESFDLSRVDPRACYVSTASRRIDGVPLFDAGFTDDAGVTGRLGPLGRYVALVCDSDVFHNVADRWPEAVDGASLARYARAFAVAVARVAATASGPTQDAA